MSRLRQFRERRGPTFGALLLAGMLVLAGCAGNPPSLNDPALDANLATPDARVNARAAVALINAYRQANGIAPLTLDPRLDAIAEAYARQMAAADRMTHALTPDLALGNRLKAADYRFSMAGENIAAGYVTLNAVFAGWRASPEHDRGMKDREATLVGIGTAYNPASPFKVYWSMIYARPPAG